MKKLLLMFFLVSLLFSCNDKKDSFSITEQSEMLQNDPIAMDFLDAITASAKLMTESSMDMNRYFEIIEPYKNDICNVKKEIFTGDIYMEDFAKITCQMRIAKKLFYKKYPSILDMNKEDRAKLFKLTVKKPEYDMDLVKKNAPKNQTD